MNPKLSQENREALEEIKSDGVSRAVEIVLQHNAEELLKADSNLLTDLAQPIKSETITHPEGTTLKVIRENPEPEQSNSSLYPFSPVMPFKMIKHKPDKEDDLLDVLDKVSKAAFSLFVKLKLQTHRATNLCHYPIEHYTKLETTSHNKKLKQLIDAGLVKRMKTLELKTPIKPHTLLLNPYLIKPPKRTAEVQSWWNLI